MRWMGDHSRCPQARPWRYFEVFLAQQKCLVRRVNFLPPATLHRLEETLDIVGHFNLEMSGERMDEFAAAAGELNDFARDDFLRHERGSAGRVKVRNASGSFARRIYTADRPQPVGGGRSGGRIGVWTRQQNRDQNDEHASKDEKPWPAQTAAGIFRRR